MIPQDLVETQFRGSKIPTFVKYFQNFVLEDSRVPASAVPVEGGGESPANNIK